MNISSTHNAEKVKSLIWKVTENKRLAFQGYGERQFKKAINQQFISVLKGVRALGYSIIPVLDSYVPTRPLEESFVLVYGRVGAYFASETFGGITKSYHPKYEIKRRRRRRFVNADQAELLESTWMQYMRRFALTEAADRIRYITQTTINLIRNSLDKSITEGLGIDKAARDLVKQWKEISTMRAKRIARTEIISASNGGSFIGAQTTGLVLEKQWLRTYDSRTRDTHKSVKPVGMDELFDVGGGMMYPGDPRGPAKETVNCRCSITYRVIE